MFDSGVLSSSSEFSLSPDFMWTPRSETWHFSPVVEHQGNYKLKFYSHSELSTPYRTFHSCRSLNSEDRDLEQLSHSAVQGPPAHTALENQYFSSEEEALEKLAQPSLLSSNLSQSCYGRAALPVSLHGEFNHAFQTATEALTNASNANLIDFTVSTHKYVSTEPRRICSPDDGKSGLVERSSAAQYQNVGSSLLILLLLGLLIFAGALPVFYITDVVDWHSNSKQRPSIYWRLAPFVDWPLLNHWKFSSCRVSTAWQVIYLFEQAQSTNFPFHKHTNDSQIKQNWGLCSEEFSVTIVVLLRPSC